MSRLENTFPLYFGRPACYCIWHVAVAVRQICAHSTFSSQEPNGHCKLWRHILLYACNVGRYLPASLVLSSCRLDDTLRDMSGLTALRAEDTPRKSPALTSFLSCLLPALLF